MKIASLFRIVSAGLQDMDSVNPKRWQWGAGTNEYTIGLLDYLNYALAEISAQRPECFSETASLLLTSGMKQTIPDGAIYLCELVRNMGSDGRTPGLPIFRAPQESVFAWYNPYNTMTRSAQYKDQVNSYMYDKSTNRKIYYVYPPVPSNKTLYVEGIYYAAPPEITSVNADLPIDVGYAQAIAHHIMASIFEGDNELTTDERGKAAYHRKMFQTCMDVKLQTDLKLPKGSVSIGK